MDRWQLLHALALTFYLMVAFFGILPLQFLMCAFMIAVVGATHTLWGAVVALLILAVLLFTQPTE